MKYKNAREILPEKLLDTIQDYIQGEYLYVPRRERGRQMEPTDYQLELEKRDAHIYTRYLEGIGSRHLAENYNLSESSIRRIISAGRKDYKAMQKRIETIMKHWNLAAASIEQIYDSAWRINDNFVLKVYDDPVAMERNLTVLKALAETDIPTGQPIPTAVGQTYCDDGEFCYVLSPRLPGSNIVDIHKPADLPYRMGEIIGNLHLVFQKCEGQEEFWNNSLLGEMKSWVKDKLEQAEWKLVSREAYREVVANLEKYYDRLPVQLIHRDVHFGNFLFDNGVFSGYIDFDLSQRNIRIFDLCYFLLGLLSEQEDIIITTEEWYGFLKGVLQGYEKRIPLSYEEKRAVPYVMEAIELLFVAWFLGERDMKCAENAESLYSFIKNNEERIQKIAVGSP